MVNTLRPMNLALNYSRPAAALVAEGRIHVESSSIPANTQDPAHVSLVVERLLADVSAMVERFGPEQVIAGNTPYWGVNGDMLRPASEASVIRRILEETGCSLLLDISHARITARHQGRDETADLPPATSICNRWPSYRPP